MKNPTKNYKHIWKKMTRGERKFLEIFVYLETVFVNLQI